MAGVVGFEPTHADTKNRCLTAWLHPNPKDNVEPLGNLRKNLSKCKPQRANYVEKTQKTRGMGHINWLYSNSC